ncbi:hypothetical protein ACFV0O_29975 [Kitasatospora sp. NPDC059577]
MAPRLQEPELSGNGGWNVRYRARAKAAALAGLRALIERHAPWLRVGYAF